MKVTKISNDNYQIKLENGDTSVTLNTKDKYLDKNIKVNIEKQGEVIVDGASPNQSTKIKINPSVGAHTIVTSDDLVGYATTDDVNSLSTRVITYAANSSVISSGYVKCMRNYATGLCFIEGSFQNSSSIGFNTVLFSGIPTPRTDTPIILLFGRMGFEGCITTSGTIKSVSKDSFSAGANFYINAVYFFN